MSKIPDEVIAEWATKKKHIQDRLNKIEKRLKKYQKQKKHFELRQRLVKEYEQRHRQVQGVPSQEGGGVQAVEGQVPSDSGKDKGAVV